MPLRSYRFVETKKKQYSNIHLIIYKEFQLKEIFPLLKFRNDRHDLIFASQLDPKHQPKTFSKHQLELSLTTSNLRLFSEKEKGKILGS